MKKSSCKKPGVFAVPGRETYSGKPVVHYAVDGNLNDGNIKTFSSYPEAVKFARQKAKEYGVKAKIHPK